ncbi:hypothetical protein [Amycolatopsis magusensis]|uniref:hypothetical protein n=1 Tax=Amycolatopsis magusensis TaxID=882444 RepID=UPI0037AFFF18
MHLVQVEATGRVSLSYLVADADGSPVIGPSAHHPQPFPDSRQPEAAAAQGLPALAAMWEHELRARR